METALLAAFVFSAALGALGLILAITGLLNIRDDARKNSADMFHDEQDTQPGADKHFQ